MALPANWTSGQQFTAAAENAVETAVNAIDAVTGLVKGTGSGVTAATAGTDFMRAHWVNVLDYGADNTGSSDSTTAFTNAIAALPTTGGWVYAPTGSYKITGSGLTFNQFQRLKGDGKATTVLNYTGSAVCITATYNGTFTGVPSPVGLEGFTVNGSGAGTGAVGVQIGNLIGSYINDISITSFTGTGDIGMHLVNTGSNWCEENRFTGITLINCTNHVVFDTGSFDYSVYEFQIEQSVATQNGVTFQNGAQLAGCRFALRGNFIGKATSNAAWVFAVDPGNTSGTSFIQNCEFDIAVEADGSNIAPKTIVMGSSQSTSQVTGLGVMSFQSVGSTFQGAALTGGSIFGVSGVINDPVLGSAVAGDAFAFQGGTQYAVQTFTAYAGMAIYPQFGDVQQITLLAATTITISGFNGAPYLRARRMKLLIIQPSSGSPGLITWPANVKWPGGTHTLSTANSAIDQVDLTYYPGENAWYGQLTLAYA